MDEVDVVWSVGAPKGLKLSHEASIIAPTESAEMKMIDSFIARNIDGAGYSRASAYRVDRNTVTAILQGEPGG